ncbi:PhzF family isomerase [Fusobacterium ulcerans]|uniref:Phenazine biosynthesis protein PhzF family protein n=1 Tax=Fusobacterium ulcerans 12-1B TaxID=457404 RepID=H1PSM2_9FUSO|nr:PhzF family isomerase [Fusobacterium ulcerans]EHO81928.1 phenazine biosynthesis protein PhzF family protein [Fusobacterium ulcerans 12-1B]
MKNTYKIYQIDSFSNKKFFGNPAGVVYKADSLTEVDMQRIARELNNSETAFIFSSDSKEYDVHVRFFTPLREVPICGHATIAAHYVIALENNFKEKTCIRQKTGAGILPVEIEPIDNSYNVIMTQGKVEFGDIIDGKNLDRLVSALGIDNDDLIKEAPVQIVSTGHSKVMIGIKDYKQLHNLRPDMKELNKLSDIINCNGYFVFTFDSKEKDILLKGRMFAPAIGIEEDPVTGNANGPVGAYIVKYNLVKIENDNLKFSAKQGMSIDREGTINVNVHIENSEPVKVQVSGTATVVFKTEIEL